MTNLTREMLKYLFNDMLKTEAMKLFLTEATQLVRSIIIGSSHGVSKHSALENTMEQVTSSTACMVFVFTADARAAGNMTLHGARNVFPRTHTQ